jgi:hypothetical protein
LSSDGVQVFGPAAVIHCMSRVRTIDPPAAAVEPPRAKADRPRLEYRVYVPGVGTFANIVQAERFGLQLALPGAPQQTLRRRPTPMCASHAVRS